MIQRRLSKCSEGLETSERRFRKFSEFFSLVHQRLIRAAS